MPGRHPGSGPPALPLHLSAATLLRVSAEGVATALVLTVHARTGRAADAGFLQAALTLPYVLSGPVIGHVMDRASRPRAVAMGVAAGYAAATAVLFLMAGRSPLILAITVAAVVGCTEPIVVALTSLLPRIVPEGRLSSAYGLEAASYGVAAVVGPLLAAGIATVLSGSHAGLPIVIAGALGASALFLLPVPNKAPGRTESLRAVVVGGLSVLAANRVLRALTVSTTLGWLAYGGVPITAVLFVQRLGEDAAAGGQLLVAFAAGSFLGSLGSTRWLKARFGEWVVLGGLVGFGTSLAALALAPSLLWALVIFLVAGLVEGPLFTATLMLRQRESPPDRLGQVNTTGGSLKIAASAIGAALTGLLADAIGPIGLILTIAAFQFAGALAGWSLFRLGPKVRT